MFISSSMWVIQWFMGVALGIVVGWFIRGWRDGGKNDGY